MLETCQGLMQVTMLENYKYGTGSTKLFKKWCLLHSLPKTIFYFWTSKFYPLSFVVLLLILDSVLLATNYHWLQKFKRCEFYSFYYWSSKGTWWLTRLCGYKIWLNRFISFNCRMENFVAFMHFLCMRKQRPKLRSLAWLCACEVH